MKSFAPLLPLVLLAACADEPTPEEVQQANDAAIAAVKAANDTIPPLEELRLQLITQEDRDRAGIEGAHCTYMPGTNSGPRLIARKLDAFIKLDDDMVRLAADTGSLEMAGGTRTVYNGRAMVVRLFMDGDEGTITIDDPHGREVYAVSGPVTCVDGATPPDNPEQADL